jgi:hypothetical protein
MRAKWIKLAIDAWLLLLLPVSMGHAQNASRMVQWSSHPQGSNNEMASPPLRLFAQLNEIEIEEVRVEGTPITIGAPFGASADWLRNMGFRVKNLSDQSLISLQITLTLPQLQGAIQIPYLAPGCNLKIKQACVQPGQEVELTMPAGGLYDWVKNSARERGTDFANINTATIMFAMVVLVDGTQWSSGCARTADPKSACPHAVSPSAR